MKEIQSIFIGQAGIQISSAFWEHFAGDHGINQEGEFVELENSCGSDRFFLINDSGQAVPRCLLVDLEPNVISEIKTGSYKRLFTSTNYVTGSEDAASIFARGYYSQGRHVLPEIMEKLRIQFENCDSLQAIAFIHSLGGGTGSGLYSLIIEELDEHSKTIKQEAIIHPSYPGGSPIIVEPYNALLVHHYSIESSDLTYMMDNESLFSISHKRLLQNKPNYYDINRIVAHGLGIITAPTRFCERSSTITEMMHNLVPYPRIHAVSIGLGPMLPREHEHSTENVFSITKSALTRAGQLLSCDPSNGKFMACCLIYRGEAISASDIFNAVLRLKQQDRTLNFVDWCPTGVKVMMCQRRPSYIVPSNIACSTKFVAIVSNNSAITDPLLHSTFRYQMLFQKRAFVHWYVGEGMEEDEFKDALDNIACLIKDYEECTLNSRLLNYEDENSKSNNKNTGGASGAGGEGEDGDSDMEEACSSLEQDGKENNDDETKNQSHFDNYQIKLCKKELIEKPIECTTPIPDYHQFSMPTRQRESNNNKTQLSPFDNYDDVNDNNANDNLIDEISISSYQSQNSFISNYSFTEGVENDLNFNTNNKDNFLLTT